jgi:hypothetical protein
MKFRLIADQRETFPVRVMCDVMDVSPALGTRFGSRPAQYPDPDLDAPLLAGLSRCFAAAPSS